MDINEIIEKHKLWLNYEEGGERANLSWANLSQANLSWADLRWANLSQADLRWADLRWADLRWANLSEADLRWADLRWANLSEADLSGANLSGANLSEADLREADLRWAVICGTTGNLSNIKSVFLEKYQITYTAEYLQIGCQRHEIEKWWAFTDAEIRTMDGRQALEWWGKWKETLKQIIEMSPAEPTGYQEK